MTQRNLNTLKRRLRHLDARIEAAERPGEVAFDRAERSALRAAIEELEQACESDSQILTWLIERANFGRECLGEADFEASSDLAGLDPDGHDSDDYQYWMRKALLAEMGEEARGEASSREPLGSRF